MKVVDKHALMKTIRIKRNYNNGITKSTKEMIRKRNKMRREAFKEQDLEKIEQYKNYA